MELHEFVAPMGAPIRGTTVLPPFRRIYLPQRTIKSTVFAWNVRRGQYAEKINASRSGMARAAAATGRDDSVSEEG
jgi:hypothetical protein